MSNQSYATLNGEEVSWADISVGFGLISGPTLDMADIEGIKWERKVDVGMSYGTGGGRPMKRTRGKVSFSASATISKSGVLVIETALAQVAPRRGNQAIIGVVPFDITIQHATISAPSVVHMTILKGCRWLGDSEDNKEGSDALFQEFTLDPLEIVKVVDGVEYALL